MLAFFLSIHAVVVFVGKWNLKWRHDFVNTRSPLFSRMWMKFCERCVHADYYSESGNGLATTESWHDYSNNSPKRYGFLCLVHNTHHGEKKNINKQNNRRKNTFFAICMHLLLSWWVFLSEHHCYVWFPSESQTNEEAKKNKRKIYLCCSSRFRSFFVPFAYVWINFHISHRHFWRSRFSAPAPAAPVSLFGPR